MFLLIYHDLSSIIVPIRPLSHAKQMFKTAYTTRYDGLTCHILLEV